VASRVSSILNTKTEPVSFLANTTPVSNTTANTVPVLTLKPKKGKRTGRHAVVSFMRMQPPHKGHEKVVAKLMELASQYRADPILFTSVKQDAKTNPLPFTEKVRFLKRLFPNIMISEHDGVRTPIQMLAALSLLKYDAVTVVVGSDRVPDFEKFAQYVKSEGTRGQDIVLSDYQVVGIARDRDAEGVQGLSSTKMREWSRDGNWEDFRAGVPTQNDALAKQLYNRLRGATGLKR